MNIPLTLTAGQLGEALLKTLRDRSQQTRHLGTDPSGEDDDGLDLDGDEEIDLRVDFLPLPLTKQQKQQQQSSSSSSSVPFDGCAYVTTTSAGEKHLLRLVRLDGRIEVLDAPRQSSAATASQSSGSGVGNRESEAVGSVVLAVIPDPWGYERGVAANPCAVVDLPGCRPPLPPPTPLLFGAGQQQQQQQSLHPTPPLSAKEVEAVKAFCGLKCGSALAKEVRVLDAPLHASVLKLSYNGRLVLGGGVTATASTTSGGGAAGGGGERALTVSTGTGVTSARRLLLLDGTVVPALTQAQQLSAGAVSATSQPRGLLRVQRCYLSNPWRPSFFAATASHNSVAAAAAAPGLFSPAVSRAQGEVGSWGGLVLGARQVVRLLLLANNGLDGGDDGGGGDSGSSAGGKAAKKASVLKVGQGSKVGSLLTHCLVAVNCPPPNASSSSSSAGGGSGGGGGGGSEGGGSADFQAGGEDGSGAASFLDNGLAPPPVPVTDLTEKARLAHLRPSVSGRKVWLVFGVADSNANHPGPCTLPILKGTSSSEQASGVVLKLAHGAARATVTLRDLADLGDTPGLSLAASPSSSPASSSAPLVSLDDVGQWLCAAKISHCNQQDNNSPLSLSSSAGVPAAVATGEARSKKAARVASALLKAPPWPAVVQDKELPSSASYKSSGSPPLAAGAFSQSGCAGGGKGFGGGGCGGKRKGGGTAAAAVSKKRMQAESEFVAVGTVKRDRRTPGQILKDTQEKASLKAAELKEKRKKELFGDSDDDDDDETDFVNGGGDKGNAGNTWSDSTECRGFGEGGDSGGFNSWSETPSSLPVAAAAAATVVAGPTSDTSTATARLLAAVRATKKKQQQSQQQSQSGGWEADTGGGGGFGFDASAAAVPSSFAEDAGAEGGAGGSGFVTNSSSFGDDAGGGGGGEWGSGDGGVWQGTGGEEGGGSGGSNGGFNNYGGGGGDSAGGQGADSPSPFTDFTTATAPNNQHRQHQHQYGSSGGGGFNSF